MDQQSPFTSESTIRRDPVVELVVQGGRYHGKRYRLPHNFTLIGNDATCELKLESREISSIQCALIQTPQGLLLRALRSDQKVSVNNQVVTDCILREDDKLRIGPVVFKVQGLLDSELMPLPDAIPQSKEREALRAQAAAVVAQQVELEEQQEALLLREKALERQHEQLSTHLEERRFKLLAIQEETRQKKKEFTEHVAATEARFREREEELKQIAEANQAQAKRLEDELKRAQALQKKLDDQYQQQFGSQEKKLQVRQAALDKREKELQGERENWRQIYLRNNGDAELKKKQHEVGCLELKRAQAAWERQKKEEQGALNAQRKECDEQLELLARAQSTLVRQDEEAHQSLARIEAETRGLEARARHLQAQLAEVEKSVDEEGVVTGNDWSQPGELRAIALLPGNVESLLTCLEQVTASLEDQRGQLKLQWEKFLQIQSSWCQEHAVLLPEVERIVEELAQREKALN